MATEKEKEKPEEPVKEKPGSFIPPGGLPVTLSDESVAKLADAMSAKLGATLASALTGIFSGKQPEPVKEPVKEQGLIDWLMRGKPKKEPAK